jgi:SpoVK/Ycf46/Vps4 family AAA+-type ATPase
LIIGTGKTSLSKALAQKLSIQMNDKYQFTHLFEINSHSLFSKWFSESGKLVAKMFQQIQEVIEIPSSLVVVLIDEVESIAFARGNISTNEPSDSVRVVNSVLTQLDKIKKYPNVLIITTSNLTKSIDLAFLDRADIIKFLENPSTDAIFKIISSAIVELAQKGVIIPDSADDGRDDFNIATIENFERLHNIENFPPFSTANIMSQICKEAVGISGRGLRKLPFLAHALYLKKDSATLREFLISMRYAIDHVKRNKENMGQFNQISGE